jgi:hypothetical protein
MTISSNQELALARELLAITSEAELNRVLSRIVRPALAGLAKVAPLVLKAAAPLLKKAAARAIPRIKSVAPRKKRPAGAGGIPDDFGFGSAVGTRDARLWGTGFQRSRPQQIQLAMSHRFMQAARRAAKRAALATMQQVKRGRPVTMDGLRRVVHRALVGAVRERAPFLLPTMGAVSASLRRAPGYTGATLPTLRPGRIMGATRNNAPRRAPGYTGPSLPTPRGTILGVRGPRSTSPSRAGHTGCKTCRHARAAAAGR